MIVNAYLHQLNAVGDLLSPCSSCLNANVRPPKLNGSSCMLSSSQPFAWRNLLITMFYHIWLLSGNSYMTLICIDDESSQSRHIFPSNWFDVLLRNRSTWFLVTLKTMFVAIISVQWVWFHYFIYGQFFVLNEEVLSWEIVKLECTMLLVNSVMNSNYGL